MPNTTDYPAYVARRTAYGFTSLDFVTWLSWHLNVSRATMNIKGR
jgi:hypothetical protein